MTMYLILIVVMILAIAWLLHDEAVFWGDVERITKNKPTKKYFTEYNKK